MPAATVNAPVLRAERQGLCFGANPARDFRKLAIAFLLAAAGTPAQAEVGATFSFFSEARLRGISLSAGHPVAQLDLSYDDSGGVYGSLSESTVFSSEYGLRPLGLQENLGYAKKLKSGPSIDVGIINANYSRYTGNERSSGYTEVYAGLVGKVLSSYIYLSPNYFHSRSWAAYGEVDAGIAPARKLRLTAHVGSLVPLGSSYASKVQYDWQIGATREAGPVSLHVAFGDGGPGRDYYEGNWHRRRALVVGATYVF
jgi:uncharacterized protein (TIGR02001 family)